MIGKETPLDDLAKQLRADLVRVYGPGDGQSSSVSAVSICRKPAIVFDRIKPSPRGLLKRGSPIDDIAEPMGMSKYIARLRRTRL
jgi:hypothetical protein